MFKEEGYFDVEVVDAFPAEAKFKEKENEKNDLRENVKVFYDVVLILKTANGNTDSWRGEISNRTGKYNETTVYRFDSTLRSLQRIGFKVKTVSDLEQQFYPDEHKNITIPNLVGIKCIAHVEKTETKKGQIFYNVRNLYSAESNGKKITQENFSKFSAASAFQEQNESPECPY